ncbi:MAG: LemA family protein [Candidatus Omnitrophica bacterium]|nr:LemA family protein [Candidatus Omnitrophota bacterium]
MALFVNGKSRKRDELRDLLDMDIISRKTKMNYVLDYLKEHYKTIFIVLFVLYCFSSNIYIYNRFNALRQSVIASKAQIDSAMQLRKNLVPALTMIVYQFINHERNVFMGAVEARENSLSGGIEMKKLAESLEGIMGKDISSQALSRFIAIAENYPNLASSQSYQNLITQISEVETRIYEKRGEYNTVVNEYNTKLTTFPANISGMIMGFKMESYFEWDNTSEWVFITKQDEGELPVSMKSGA